MDTMLSDHGDTVEAVTLPGPGNSRTRMPARAVPFMIDGVCWGQIDWGPKCTTDMSAKNVLQMLRDGYAPTVRNGIVIKK